MDEENLIIKKVGFQGDELLAIKEIKSNKIYVGVNFISNVLGLNERKQRDKIKEHLTLSKGCTILGIPSNGGNQDTYVIELNYLPLWLATINPSKVKEDVTEKLIEYQLKAKDILAEAFIKKQTSIIPKTLQEALREYANTLDELEEEKKTNEILAPKAEKFDLFMNSKTSLDMGSFAKSIKVIKRGKVVGRNTLFGYLRNKKLLMNNNIPYQRFVEQKLFEVIEVVKMDKVFSKTLVTPKGADYIIDMLKADNFIVERIHKELN